MDTHPVTCICGPCLRVVPGASNVCRICKKPLDDHVFFGDHDRAICPVKEA